MRVVFHCYGGTHASPVAAALYLGRLDEGRRPTLRRLLSLALFDRVSPRDFGRLIPVGEDRWGNRVYILGCGRYPDIVLRALEGFTDLLGLDADELVLADVVPCINLLMRFGGYASRALGWVWLGRPLVAWGTLLAFPNLVSLAQETRQRVAQRRREAPE
jgi:hypothetical protein